MTATVTNFSFFSSGLGPSSRGVALLRDQTMSIFGYEVAQKWRRILRHLAGLSGAMSGESKAIWSISGVASFGFVALVFGGGAL